MPVSLCNNCDRFLVFDSSPLCLSINSLRCNGIPIVGSNINMMRFSKGNTGDIIMQMISNEINCHHVREVSESDENFTWKYWRYHYADDF